MHVQRGLNYLEQGEQLAKPLFCRSQSSPVVPDVVNEYLLAIIKAKYIVQIVLRLAAAGLLTQRVQAIEALKLFIHIDARGLAGAR